MSDSKPILSPENVPTIAAVGVVTGLLSLAFGFYLNNQIMRSAVMTGAIAIHQEKADAQAKKDLDALTARVALLEAAAATAAAETAAAAVEPAVAAPQ